MINFDLKEVFSLSTLEEAYQTLSKHFKVISPREFQSHIRVLQSGDVYGLRKVGSKWVGYKKTATIDPDSLELLGQWDGIWNQAFQADTLQEAVTSLAYLLQAEGCLEEFKRLLSSVSYFKP